jgi:hypothetical protein
MSYHAKNDTFTFSSMDRTCMALYMNVTLTGITGEDVKIRDMFIKHVEEVFAKPVDPSALHEEAEYEHHEVYNLPKGESQRIKAIKECDAWDLPSVLNLSFSMDYLGNEITVHEKGISFTSLDLNLTAVVITIEPLTDGVHSYDVCVINGCVIFIREIKTNG